MRKDDQEIRPQRCPMGTNRASAARPGRPTGSHRKRQPAVRGCGALSLACRHPLARPARALWRFPCRAHPPLALELQRCVAAHLRGTGAGRRQRIRHDRLHHRARPPALCRGKRGDPEKQAIGRSRGGLSTKIHTRVDALGNPTGFVLTPGQAHDLQGADVLLKDTPAQTVIADKAYDAQARLVQPLLSQGKAVVIPSRATSKRMRLAIPS